MKRLTLVLVVLVVFAVPGSALARTYGSPGSMSDGEYKYVENPDGTFTEYYRNEGGAVQRGSTYSNAGMAEADRLVRQTSTEAGTSGQGGSVVSGADSQDIYASERALDDIRTGKPYVTPGEAEVGDELVADAEAVGTLPGFATVAGAMWGAVSVAGTAYWGVKIGDSIDELVGWPTLDIFGNSHSGLTSGGTIKKSASWRNEVYIGELKTCHKVVPFAYPVEEATVKCFEAGGAFDETVQSFYEGEWHESTSRKPETGFAASGGIPAGEEGTPCPKKNIPLSCFSVEPNNYNLYQDYHANPPERHMFPAPEKAVEEAETGSKKPSGSVPARSPVTTPIPVPSPSEVPAPLRHWEIAHGKEKEGKPVVLPIEEPAPGEEPIPSPTNPEVPQPKPNELYTQYKSELESAGFTDIEKNTLPESEIDTSVGPEDVTDVSPEPGSRVAPDTPVRVDVNPPNSPNPSPGGTGGGTACGLTPPSASLDTKPFTEQSWSEVFPFSMVIFAREALSGLATEPERPNQGFFVFGKEVGNLSFLSHFDTVIGIWRDCLAFLLTVAAAQFLWRRTLGS